MLHRPADSRLLTNLLSHEKEHAKALAVQIDSAQASLNSFSAYASASPPPASHAIVAVAGTLVGANDALRNYLFAVEEWCEQLRELKELEDEVGNVVRDREILVDRLIKASKSTQKRRSVVSNSGGSPTSNMFASSSAVGLEQLAFSNSKLNLAQNELQACEAHLADREKALAQMRENIVIKGLKGRCKAMVECGWKWGEMGKEGMRALEGVNMNMNGYISHSDNQFLKPLPDPHATHSRPSSDMSSIAPSQSASQIVGMGIDGVGGTYTPFSSPGSSQAHGSGMASTSSRPVSDAGGHHEYVLQIPPAHSISDQLLPPSRVIQEEEEEEGGGSSEGESEEDAGALEVHENKPFAVVNKTRQSTPPPAPPPAPKRRDEESPRRPDTLPASFSAPMPASTRSHIDIYGNSRDSPPRERKNSNFLGSFMGLFHKRGRAASLSSLPSVNGSPPKTRKGSPWITRTDKNLKKSTKEDDSSDEEPGRSPLPKTSINYEALRQKSIIEAKALPSPSGQQPSPERRKGTKKLRKPSEAQRKSTADSVVSKVSQNADRPSIPKSASKKSLADDSVTSSGTNETIHAVSAPISRSSTVKSASSNVSSRRAASLDGGPSRTPSRRVGTRSDLGQGSSPARSTAASPSPSARNGSHARNFSTPVGANGMSLMSIIEDVTAANRRGWNSANPNSLLFEVKAPPTSVLVDDIVSTLPETPSPASRTAQPVRQGSNASTGSAQMRRFGSVLASSSEPHLPLSRGSSRTARTTDRPPVPLRSALRNRSPSPMKPAPVMAPRSSSPAKLMEQETRPRANSPSAVTPRIRELTMPSNSRRDSFASDTSVSSYATGREEFEEEEEQLMIDPNPQPSESESTPQQATIELPTFVNGLTNGMNPHRHDAEGKQPSESASSDSTSGPSRRKSVRMAPLPTFSPTPPAIYDEEMDHAPWDDDTQHKSSITGWQSRVNASDVWEDSDASDEEYSRAKEMLWKVSQKSEKKKQASY